MNENHRDDLLRYYETELEYLRSAGAAFAQKYPKIASRLELSTSQSGDPHVERLIEAFAFLAARIHLNIDAEFPEISYALLDNLYPHFLEPIPSMSIARIALDPTANVTSPLHIPRNTLLYADLSDGYTLTFRTAYSVALYPFEVSRVEICEPGLLPPDARFANAAAAIRIRIQSLKAPVAQFAPPYLRFYLGANKAFAFELYELLQTQLIDVGIADPAAQTITWLGSDCLREVGFHRDEALLPFLPTAHPQYRLLQEYFALPEKFLFVDITRLDTVPLDTSSFEILLPLRTLPNEHRLISTESFALNCTPVVNLFPKISEPVAIDHRQVQYRLVADARRDLMTEVHSIAHLSGSMDPESDTEILRPYFSLHHGTFIRASDRVYWYARRVPTLRKDKPGTEMYLSFVDREFRPSVPASGVVFGHILCTNRHLAHNLPERSPLTIDIAGLPLRRVELIHQPTPQFDPPLSGSIRWRVISHLSLNYLSLTNPETALATLHEILRLYNVGNIAYLDRQIEGITALTVQPIVRRVGDTRAFGYLRGKEITLTLDEELFTGSSALLLARVLREFYRLHEQINSFTLFAVNGVRRPSIWKTWSPDIPLQWQ
jgi:type VI secretion system protein ImpG